MGAYVIGVVGATVIGAVISVLTPDRWDKYVGIVTGIVITLCIARPITGLMDGDIFVSAPEIRKESIANGQEIFANELKKEMESRIGMDIKDRLSAEFGKNCVARVSVDVSGRGEVIGVREILIRGDRIDAVAKSRLREIYGAQEVKYVGP